MALESIKWGEDPERDCAELQRLESMGRYPNGHHDQMCSVHSEAPPVSNFAIAVPEAPVSDDPPPTPPRDEITD